MRILHLSDTHGSHRRLTNMPDADIVVHSGDFTMTGSEKEALDFLNWLCDLPHAHKIFICGNHDDCLYGANIDGLDPNVLRKELPGLKVFSESSLKNMRMFYEEWSPVFESKDTLAISPIMISDIIFASRQRFNEGKLGPIHAKQHPFLYWMPNLDTPATSLSVCFFRGEEVEISSQDC